MAAKNNQEHLRNKFLGVEMSLADSEIKFTLASEKIKQITKVKNKDIPLIFVYSRLLIRISKVILSAAVKAVGVVWINVIGPVVKEINKTLVYSLGKINNAKEESEISLDNYLTKYENELLTQKNEKKEVVHKINIEQETYEKNVNQVFEGTDCNFKLICDNSKFEKIKTSLEFDITIYEQISLKLTSSKLITNVTSLSIKSEVNEKTITNTVEFDLKVSGEKWSKLFAKHIASEVLSKMEGSKGKMKITHFVDPRHRTEKLVLVFTHQHLELSVFNESKNKKVKTLEKSNRLSSLDI
jgi:hypothetical protein